MSAPDSTWFVTSIVSLSFRLSPTLCEPGQRTGRLRVLARATGSGGVRNPRGDFDQFDASTVR
jgi:hypothetical protein